MQTDKYRQRLDELFASISQLTADPACLTPSVQAELELMRGRLQELEAQIKNIETTAKRGAPHHTHSAPILYEKERVGYLYSENRLEPIRDPQMIQHNNGNTLTAALTASGETIGKVSVKPGDNHNASEDGQKLLEAVAQQASLQIQNLRLLAATERARAEAESATRSFIHEGWENFMDAIHQSERVGYAFDQSDVVPFIQLPAANSGYREVISVMDEQVGMVYLQPQHELSQSDRELVSAVANRIAQQVENIRLLADAARARAEAEEATRRLTREGWQTYTKRLKKFPAYMYKGHTVVELEDQAEVKESGAYIQPINIRGERVGQLAVAGTLSDKDMELTEAVANQVSAQLESLRLLEQNEKRAADLSTVAEVSTTASKVLDPDDLLQQVVNLTKERFNLYHAHIYLADESWNTLLLAVGAGDIGSQMVNAGHAIEMDAKHSLVARAVREKKAIIANDVRNEADFLPNPLLPETRAEMAVPMIVGDKVLGVLDVQSENVGQFTEEDVVIKTTLATQIAIALQNARLYQEQSATVAQLRELDRLKSSFLANMSHELRTPLNSILGFSDVILEELDGPLTPHMTNDLKLIQKNGQHLLHLINDVLDMAKIESGKLNLIIETFNLHDIIEEVTSITSLLASEKDLALFIEPNSDHDVHISADRTRLRQVLINLVNNAMKFTDKGKISIRATCEKSNVLISVKDTGIGIPPDQLEAVFQEFTQVDSTTTRKVGGTGLGLPISRRLIQMHGGRLWAESSGVDGEGSTFYIFMPIEANVAESEPVTKAK